MAVLRRMLMLTTAVLLLLAAIGIILALSYPLPPLERRTTSTYIADTADTPLGRGIAAAHVEQGPDISGAHLLVEGRAAFAARVLLARAAVRSLDVQYYIWSNDLSGTLLLEEMQEAADRGVRVRMLLDDNGVTGLDRVLAALDSHPNIEIRLFNPFVLRHPKMLGYLADFPRLNRRMHNKSFIADGQAAIVGGRNVGDAYFGAGDGDLFLDLDVLAVGPVVGDTSRDFDRYWASKSAYPVAAILPSAPDGELAILRQRASKIAADKDARAYMDAIRTLPFVRQVLEGTLPFEWAKISIVSDDPAKGVGAVSRGGLLSTALRGMIGLPKQDVHLMSSYFVPTQAGVDAFSSLVERGVDVSVFTNAFETTDVWIVHAGYAERRKDMLRAGIRLFELRKPGHADIGQPRRSIFGLGSGSGAASGGRVLRASASTLHAKTFTVDGSRLIIGSFNFDPRSMHLNTELGFVIESPYLSRLVSDMFDTAIPAHAYELMLGKDGRLNWREERAGGAVIHTTEPGTSVFQRWGIRILSYMPIEWLL